MIRHIQEIAKLSYAQNSGFLHKLYLLSEV